MSFPQGHSTSWLDSAHDRAFVGGLVAFGLAGVLAACVGPSVVTPTAEPTVTRQRIDRLATSTPFVGPILSGSPIPPEIGEARTPEPTSTPGVERVVLDPDVCPVPTRPVMPNGELSLQAKIAYLYEPILVDYLNGGGMAEGIPDHLALFPTEDFAIVGPFAITGPTLTYLRAVDLAGDSEPEIVVGLDWNRLAGALYVLGREAGSFRALLSLPIGVTGYQTTGRGGGIRALVDLNRNGRWEILYSYLEEVEITDPTRQDYQYFSRRLVELLEWNGTAFEYLPFSTDGTAPFACRAEVSRGDLELLDRDEDGELELILESGTISYSYTGSQRVRREMWEWKEDHLQFTYLDIAPPEFRFQAVQEGDDQVRLGEFDLALTRYLEALFDPDLLAWSPDRKWADDQYHDDMWPVPTPDADERPRLEAYARYRLVVLHAARGDAYSARIAYDELLERASTGPGRVYADLATAFWEAYEAGQEIAAGCTAAAKFARSHAGEVLAPLGAGYYGWANRNYEPADICPFVMQP